MRALIVTAFVSLDGVMEAPGGEAGYRNAGWTFKDIEFDPAAYEIKGREQEEAGALLLGRTSATRRSPRCGRRWTRTSPATTRCRATWCRRRSSRTTRAGPRPSCARSTTSPRSRRPTAARSSVHGSATLGASLADAGLVDRYHLLVFPLLLGAGKRLFSEADKDTTKLTLVEHEAYANGIQKQVFDVVR